jgi:hypothetical protein
MRYGLVPLVHFDETVFKETCYLTVFKMRRGQRLQIRVVVASDRDNGAWVYEELKKFTLDESGRQAKIKPKVTIAATVEIHKRMTVNTREVPAQHWETIPRLRWENPTYNDLKLRDEEEKKTEERYRMISRR